MDVDALANEIKRDALMLQVGIGVSSLTTSFSYAVLRIARPELFIDFDKGEG